MKKGFLQTVMPVFGLAGACGILWSLEKRVIVGIFLVILQKQIWAK